jgi:23S rRNA (uridine2552-2'-O)-methyltransferase
VAYNPKDFYFKKAKENNFLARSVFKLEEMNKKYKLLKPGSAVLDLGCSPGSWSQYACKIIGNKGLLLGVDLTPMKITLPNARFLTGDAFDKDTLDRFMANNDVESFDVVMSDMAPKTTGVRIADQERSLELCYRALEVAELRLKKDGHFVVKIFQSGDTPKFVEDVRKIFTRVETPRPKSVRAQSYEIYVVGVSKK